jgi:hypothetical protein
MQAQTPISERLRKVLDELESILKETENATTGA